MAENQDTVDRSLINSIAMLEQILEVMPHDSEALRALYSAYRKGGQHEQAFEYLTRLVSVCLAGSAREAGETGLFAFIGEELQGYEAQYPSEVAALAARLKRAVNTESGSGSGAEVQRANASQLADRATKKEADISEELALAWRLYEENQLSQEEYSSVLHDLTEVSSKALAVPVSVLHVLHDRGFTQMNRIMNYLSARSGVPGISLSLFELAEGIAEVLPVEMSRHEGALPFAFLGNDLLVAVLNPFNNMLVDKIESVSGRRCHTYLVDPEDYDQALGRLCAAAEKATPAAHS